MKIKCALFQIYHYYIIIYLFLNIEQTLKENQVAIVMLLWVDHTIKQLFELLKNYKVIKRFDYRTIKVYYENFIVENRRRNSFTLTLLGLPQLYTLL